MAITIEAQSLYTVEELAELFGVQDRTIREYIREGRLRGRKFAKRWYVSGQSVMSYFEQGAHTDEDEEDE